jgi:hypothetical protein
MEEIAGDINALELLLKHTFDLRVDIENITILSSNNASTRFEYEEVADLLQVRLFFNIQNPTAVPDHSTVHRWTFHRKQWEDCRLSPQCNRIWGRADHLRQER